MCRHGACSGRWKAVGHGSWHGVLKRRGKTYTTNASVNGWLRCGSVPVRSSFDLTLHVTAGAAVNGEWRAALLSGSLSVNSTPQLGCVASSVTYRAAARSTQ